MIPSQGDDWSSLVGVQIWEPLSTTNSLFSNVRRDDRIRLTWGQGSATFLVPNITTVGGNSALGLSDVSDIVGTIGRTFTNGESFTLEVDVIKA